MRIKNRTGAVFRSYIIVIPETVEDITQVTLISMMIQLRKFKAMKTEITTQAEVMSKYQRKESSSSFFIQTSFYAKTTHFNINIVYEFHVKSTKNIQFRTHFLDFLCLVLFFV